MDRASPDPERLGHPQDTNTLRKVLSHLAFGRAVYLRTAELYRPSYPDRPQRARQIIAESGFTGLFEALKRGVALPAVAFVPLIQLFQQQEEGSRLGE